MSLAPRFSDSPNLDLVSDLDRQWHPSDGTPGIREPQAGGRMPSLQGDVVDTILCTNTEQQIAVLSASQH